MSVSRARGVLVGLLVALLCLAAYAVPSTRGALNGKVTNTNDTAASDIYATCRSAATGAGTALFVLPLADSASTAADVSGNGRPGRYRGNYGLGRSGPCVGETGRSVELGAGGLLTSPGYVSNGFFQANPQTFTTSLWFRTDNGYTRGGRLMGFGGDETGVSDLYDRHVFMRTDGRLVFGVFPQEFRTVTSGSAYNDGQWHHVAATLGPSGSASPGMRLYVDGTQVGSDPTTTSAQVFNGYWRVGYDNLDTWATAPRTANSFLGRVAYASVFSTALTASQVGVLAEAGR